MVSVSCLLRLGTLESPVAEPSEELQLSTNQNLNQAATSMVTRLRSTAVRSDRSSRRRPRGIRNIPLTTRGENLRNGTLRAENQAAVAEFRVQKTPDHGLERRQLNAQRQQRRRTIYDLKDSSEQRHLDSAARRRRRSSLPVDDEMDLALET